MQLTALGGTGLTLSRLGFGTLTLSPSQRNLPPAAAAELYQLALEAGVNWFDTAEYYDNYEQLAFFLRRLARPPILVAKAYAITAADVRRSLERIRCSLDLPVIDVFMLHEQLSPATLAGHAEAWQTLVQAREQGLIRAVGVSTHAESVVRALTAARRGRWSDPDLDLGLYRECDVVFPLLSRQGLGLVDGSAEGMRAAARQAAAAGLGVLGMKLFGGGHERADSQAVFRYAARQTYVTGWAVGMQSAAEISLNAAGLQNQSLDPDLLARTRQAPRQLHIEPYCLGCGDCLGRCHSQALSIRQGRAVVDPSRCTLCGYCALACPEFALKVY